METINEIISSSVEENLDELYSQTSYPIGVEILTMQIIHFLVQKCEDMPEELRTDLEDIMKNFRKSKDIHVEKLEKVFRKQKNYDLYAVKQMINFILLKYYVCYKYQGAEIIDELQKFVLENTDISNYHAIADFSDYRTFIINYLIFTNSIRIEKYYTLNIENTSVLFKIFVLINNFNNENIKKIVNKNNKIILDCCISLSDNFHYFDEILENLQEDIKFFVLAEEAYISEYVKVLNMFEIEKVCSIPMHIVESMKKQGYEYDAYSLLIFSNSGSKNTITFDFEQDGHKKNIEVSKEVVRKEYNDILSTHYIFHKNRQRFNEIIAENKVIIQNVCAFVKSIVKKTKKKAIDVKGTYPIITADFLRKLKEKRITVEDTEHILKYGDSVDTSLKNTTIVSKVVLISLSFSERFYVAYTEFPVALGKNVIALEMNDNIDLDYFMLQLESELVTLQAEMLHALPSMHMDTEDFLNIKIIVPSIEAQQRQVLEMQKRVISALGEKLEKATEEIKETEYDVIATITHNLGQKLGSVVDEYEALLRVFKRAEKEQKLLRFSDTLMPLELLEVQEGEHDTIEKLATRLQTHLIDATTTLKKTEDILQKSKINEKKQDFIRFLNKIVEQYEHQNYNICLDTTVPKALVSFDEVAMKDVFRNLIENAKRHGFLDDLTVYNIIIEVHKMPNDLRIICKNDGIPFPKNFTFAEYKRLGGRSGKHKNTGLGGFFINKVIDLHRGKFNQLIVTDEKEPFQVQFEILLPLI